MPSTLTLNGIALPLGLVWQERGGWQPVQQVAERLLGGREYTEYAPLIGGMPITLAFDRVGGGVQGMMLQSVADQIEALASVPGATYTLVINSASYTVLFRHEEPPAFSYTPVIKRLSPQAGDWVLPTIKLKTP